MKKINMNWTRIGLYNLINLFIVIIYVFIVTKGDNNEGISGLIGIFSFIFFVALTSTVIFCLTFIDIKTKLLNGLLVPVTIVICAFVAILNINGNIHLPIQNLLFMLLVVVMSVYFGNIIGIFFAHLLSFMVKPNLKK